MSVPTSDMWKEATRPLFLLLFRGGALLMSMIGAADMTSVAVVTPMIGRMDALGPGSALQMIAVLGAILAVIFSVVWLYFKATGGYRVVHMSTVSAK